MVPTDILLPVVAQEMDVTVSSAPRSHNLVTLLVQADHRYTLPIGRKEMVMTRLERYIQVTKQTEQRRNQMRRSSLEVYFILTSMMRQLEKRIWNMYYSLIQ